MSLSARFVLLEGVNVLDNIYDTDQLSVIRGSSALFKSAIVAVEQYFSPQQSNPEGGLLAVSTGASSGLFLLVDGDADKLASVIQEYLSQHQKFRYLTFQIQHCEADSLAQARSRLWTKLRLSQLQSFTTVPDWSGTDKESAGVGVCELEGRRLSSAGLSSVVQGNQSKLLSASVYHRLVYGRDHREDFYENELSGQPQAWSRLMSSLHANPACNFASSFEELCHDDANHYPKLQNKMAVVYIDGNEFGMRQREFIDHYLTQAVESEKSDIQKEIAAQQAFDHAIKARRAAFMASEISTQLDSLPSGGVIPIETLMWGGDELLMVMPAWQGFDFIQRFFDFDWRLDDSSELSKLTHAAGVVFCQAKTPIRVIQSLAYELAESVKNQFGRHENGWDYLVLESVDYPTSNDLSDYFKTRYSEAAASYRLPALTAVTNWQEHREALAQAKAGGKLSKRQLYQIVTKLLTQTEQEDPDVCYEARWQDITESVGTPEAYGPQLLAEQRLYQVNDDKPWLRDTLPELAKSVFACDMNDTKQRAWLWLHLLELWDYIAVEAEK